MKTTIITIIIFLSIFFGLFAFTAYALFQDDAIRHEILIEENGNLHLINYYK